MSDSIDDSKVKRTHLRRTRNKKSSFKPCHIGFINNNKYFFIIIVFTYHLSIMNVLNKKWLLIIWSKSCSKIEYLIKLIKFSLLWDYKLYNISKKWRKSIRVEKFRLLRYVSKKRFLFSLVKLFWDQKRLKPPCVNTHF